MIPIWVYFILAGIVVSAIMAIKTGKDERKSETQMIEREGDVYMKRIEVEKEKRQSLEG